MCWLGDKTDIDICVALSTDGLGLKLIVKQFIITFAQLYYSKVKTQELPLNFTQDAKNFFNQIEVPNE